MILPGQIFIKRNQIRWNDRYLVLFAVLFLNLVAYLFITLPENFNDEKSLRSFSVDQKLQISSLQKMYQQTQDPLVATELEASDLSFLKDQVFWERSQSFPFRGDTVEIEKNRKLLLSLKDMYSHSSQLQFGLSHQPTTPWAWLTYQFMHAGVWHLLTNMLFLILILNLLSKRVQTGWILSVYILGGIGAGVTYLLFSPSNEISMVGASGALCALIAFLSVVENKKNIQWSYFISPIEGGFGNIYLPAYLLFPVYLISDFTTVLYYSAGVHQSVAHSAHIGGALSGFVLGLLFLADEKMELKINSILQAQNHDASYSPSQQ
jgi:membrane associated rhomboid family serine protease